MIKTLGQELVAEGLLSQDDAVVVAVSGGADSVALLHILLELNRNFGWKLRLHVAHLNHTLRGDEAEQDAAFVQAACDSLSIPCTIDRRDVAALSEADSIGVEETARRERYAFYERVCLQIGFRIVALGHQADDNAETVLHRILRGTGLRGLVGIPRSRPLSPGSDLRVIRPLLSLTRESLREYLADAAIVFREDRSNASNEPMRNRIRNVILPLVRTEVNPQAREALVRLAFQAQWLDEFLQETVQRTFETLIISRTDQELKLNADTLSRKSRIVQAELVRRAYALFGLGEQDLSFNHLVSVLDLVEDPASGRQTKLPGGMTIEKRYHQLVFSLPSDEPREAIAPDVAIHLPGKTLLPVRGLEITCSIEKVESHDVPRLRREATPFEEFVDLGAVHAPLFVRSRRPGERFFPLGAPGSKKLSDFLTDLKVDPKDRQRLAILCDQLGPIWVIGHRIDDRVKLTALTRQALHLSARSLDQ